MQQTTFYFCTYKNAATNGNWCKSNEYTSVDAMLTAMRTYLNNNPRTQVTFQTRVVTTQVQP